MKAPARPGWVAFGSIVIVAGLLWRGAPVPPLTIFDQPFYLGIAHDLVQDGRFTDGFMFANAGSDGRRAPGMRFAPLYPGLVAAASMADGRLRRGMDCVVATSGRDSGCVPGAGSSLRCLQFAMLCGFCWLVWWMAGVAGGAATAWLALLLTMAVMPLLLRSVQVVMTEMTCLALSTAAMAAGVAALRAAGRLRVRWSAGAGVLLALSVLTRPGFAYLMPACAMFLLLRVGRQAWPALGAAALAAALVMAPWLARNWLVLGEAGLSHGYASHTLVQRIAFDTMSWREYGLGYVCWLPDGRAIGRALTGVQACDRFGWDDPNSFYLLGLRHMLPATLAAAGGYPHHLRYLLHTFVLRMPLKHLLVSIPLALRGAYVDNWWGLVLLPMAVAITVRALRRRGEGAYLIMALPAWFMLAFNAAVSVNQVRYNLLLIPAYATAGAFGLRRLGWRVRAPGAS